MQALTLNSFDGPDAVSVGDVSDPVAARGQVLVAVEAAGIGAWDAQTSYGAFSGMGGQATFPQVIGWDFTGRITDLGEGVTGWNVGDPGLGFTAQPWSCTGSFATHLAVEAATLAARPASLSIERAAAFPVSALTADLATRAAAPSPGTTVLVIGAAGGVGSLVTQLLARAGADVIASVSPGQAELVRSAGARTTVDRSGDVAAAVLEGHGPVDVLIDLVGPSAWTGAMQAVRRGGRFVTTVPLGTPDDSLGLDSTVIGVTPDPTRLADLAHALAAGDLVTTIADVTPLAEGPARLAAVAAGGLAGKVVLTMVS
jgi:NADPH:quinone reductase